MLRYFEPRPHSMRVEVIPAAVFAHEAAVFGHAYRAAAANAIAGQKHHFGSVGAGDDGALYGQAEPGGAAALVQRQFGGRVDGCQLASRYATSRRT